MWKAHGRARRAAVSGALVIGALGTFGLGISQVAATELKVATYLPPTHKIVALYEQLGKDLAADSKGDLTLKVYPGGTLGAGPFQQYKRAVEGTADIADICHPFHSKVFAKTMLIVLPGSATSAVDATTRLWDLPEGMLASDYKEVKNVFTYTVSQAVLTSRDKPVRSLADLKGAKVFTPGAAFAPIIAAWGGSPVPMAFDRRGRHGGTPVDVANAAVPTGRNLKIHQRRRLWPVQSLRRRHEQGELCGVDTVAEGYLRQAHRQSDEPKSREDLRRLVRRVVQDGKRQQKGGGDSASAHGAQSHARGSPAGDAEDARRSREGRGTDRESAR